METRVPALVLGQSRRAVLCDLGIALAVAGLGAVSTNGVAFIDTWELITYGVIVTGVAGAALFRRSTPRASLAVLGMLLAVHVVAVPDATFFAAGVCLLAAYTTQTQLSGL